MKILCIADIHGYTDGVISTRNYAVENDVDYIFLMGDYSVGFKDPKQNLTDIEYVLDFLKDDAGLYALPGNCDQLGVISIIEKHGESLHEKTVELDGISFIGFGGSNSTPFATPTEHTEEEIYDKLSKLYMKAKSKTVILVTHFPPKDTKCDRIPSGAHVGSTSLRRFIEEKKPHACVCSHIHESGGQEDQIGQTKIINVGMLSHGNAVVIQTKPLSIEHVIISQT
jgi:Icc-related predicted phosphoesterase